MRKTSSYPTPRRLTGSIVFKGILVLGLFLALLMLHQSFVGYSRVSRQLITDQLEKEAARQTAAVERELRASAASDSARLAEVLEEIRREAPQKTAWIKILDSRGKSLIQTGTSVDWTISEANIHSAFEDHIWLSGIRETAEGQVKIAVMPLRIRVPRPAPAAGAAEAAPPPPPSPAPRLIEMGLYLESVAESYGPLRRNLVVSCLAALSLAIARVFLWLQFPRFVRSRRLEEQLEMARQVQADLLPPADPVFKGMELAASCVAAWQVGGDFYDVFRMERGRTAFVLGDVSGKGIPAALLMGMLHGAVRAMAWSETGPAHESATRRLNGLLESQTSAERFASLFWGFFDPQAQTLNYVNAGHLPPALIRREAGGELAIRRLVEGGPVLGILPEVAYRQGTAAVQPGDLLVLYSDGIVEAANASGEEFGEERLWEVIRSNWDRSPGAIREELLSQVRQFLQREQPQDDMTLMVVRLGLEPERQPALQLQPAPQRLELPRLIPAFEVSRGTAGASFTSI